MQLVVRQCVAYKSFPYMQYPIWSKNTTLSFPQYCLLFILQDFKPRSNIRWKKIFETLTTSLNIKLQSYSAKPKVMIACLYIKRIVRKKKRKTKLWSESWTRHFQCSLLLSYMACSKLRQKIHIHIYNF